MPITEVTQRVKIDLNTCKNTPVAFAHQNDTSRTIIFDVMNNGAAMDLTGYTVKFAYMTPVVNGVYSVIAGNSMVSGTVDSTHTNSVYFQPTMDYTAVSGTGLLTMILKASSNTTDIRPVNIQFAVQKSADGADVIAGTSDFPTTVEDTVEDYLENSLGGFGIATVAETKSYLGI